MIGEFVGSYRIMRLLGQGTMSEVYLAEHPLLGRLTAVKLLRPAPSRDAAIIRRCRNEAHAVSRLRHPGIVDVLDFGVHPGGRAFLISEYLEGESLRSRLDRERRLPTELAIEIAGQAAAAVATAHDAGIFHRDLKPANLFLARDPENTGGWLVKVLDFGVPRAVAFDRTDARTEAALLLGTPAYMAPAENAGALRADRRSDVYALGCILFEMLLGQTPFTTNSDTDMLIAHQSHPIPPLERNGVDRDLAPIIRRALAKSASARYQTLRALSADLLGIRWRDRNPTGASLLEGKAPTPLAAMSCPMSARGRVVQLPRRTRPIPHGAGSYRLDVPSPDPAMSADRVVADEAGRA